MESITTFGEREQQKAPQPQIRVLEATETYGKFAMEPLEAGFGITLGNPLRRVLLGAIPGAAVTWVRIEGVLHEYTTIPHMKEDVLEFLQNVKAIRIRPLASHGGRMRLSVQGPGVVHAGDISVSADFEIVNPELYLATLDSPEARLEVEFNVEQGRGYRPAQQGDGLPIGTLPVDAIFTPVRKVNFTVEPSRVGQAMDYERLVLEVWTDGTITPVEALRKAAEMLQERFFLFRSVSQEVEAVEKGAVAAIPPDVYNMPVEKLELSSRTLNSLRRAGIEKVGQILERSRHDLMGLRNFGEKSMEELLNRLRDKNLPIPETLLGAREGEGEK